MPHQQCAYFAGVRAGSGDSSHAGPCVTTGDSIKHAVAEVPGRVVSPSPATAQAAFLETHERAGSSLELSRP